MVKIYSIVLFSFLFFLLPFSARAAANLSITPASGTYEVGETIVAHIAVSSDVSLNAVSGSVLFPTSLFSIQSVSKNGSILNFWVSEPTFGVSGVVRFEGVVLNGSGAYSGSVLTVILKAKKAGPGVIGFQSGQVLANDGQGTDITGSLSDASYTVVEPSPEVKKIVVPATEPAPEPPVVVATLKAPDISRGSKYGSSSILGTSDYPNAQVLLTFTADDGTKIFILGLSEADGSFNVIVPNSLKRGSYYVTAIMVQNDNKKSQISNLIIIEVGSIFSDMSGQVKVLFGLLILAILYLIFRVFHHIKRSRSEVKKITHKSLDVLRKDIHAHEHSKLSDANRTAMERLEYDIDSAEKIIDKEIDEIES